MATILDKELKRQINIDGAEYTLTIDPEGFRLTGKGKRTPEAQLRWSDLLSGDAALAVSLNASLSTKSASKAERGKATAPTSRSTSKKLPR
jgi:hypothetical protein